MPRVSGWALREQEGTGRYKVSSLQGLWTSPTPGLPAQHWGDRWWICEHLYWNASSVPCWPPTGATSVPGARRWGGECAVLFRKGNISRPWRGINYFVCWTLAFWQIYLNYRLTVSVGTEGAISMNGSLIYYRGCLGWWIDNAASSLSGDLCCILLHISQPFIPCLFYLPVQRLSLKTNKGPARPAETPKLQHFTNELSALSKLWFQSLSPGTTSVTFKQNHHLYDQGL